MPTLFSRGLMARAAERRIIRIVCSSCEQPWTDNHVCPLVVRLVNSDYVLPDVPMTP